MPTDEEQRAMDRLLQFLDLGKALEPAAEQVSLDIETTPVAQALEPAENPGDTVAIEIQGIDLSNEVDRTVVQIRGAEPDFVYIDELTDVDGPAWDQIVNRALEFDNAIATRNDPG